MLFILTGEVQIGKTRWLCQLTDELRQQSAICFGVLAPGVWIERGREDATNPSRQRTSQPLFEKLGIDNILLPQGTRIHFATRRDIAQKQGALDEMSQSESLQLGWHISDTALAQVNAHLGKLPVKICGSECAGLLVIDEIGRLELHRGLGLTEAMCLLEEGPCGCLRHALVVARSTLAEDVANHFGSAWEGYRFISPDDEAKRCILDIFEDSIPHEREE